ncbi:Pumilio domain-containing protein [Dorcoceras hygrometricum]|uniref:Pumilio domain-containing protein n=1 Tax=Dorcoceras hygrometricum TaxID=472368 RepID=A0A2Z7CBB4_9LAMI|nr:Pumilio domain-containing protein [Dorcoceras hygrometricum]
MLRLENTSKYASTGFPAPDSLYNPTTGFLARSQKRCRIKLFKRHRFVVAILKYPRLVKKLIVALVCYHTSSPEQPDLKPSKSNNNANSGTQSSELRTGSYNLDQLCPTHLSQQTALNKAQGNPGSTAGRGFNPAGGAPGGG